MAHATVLYIGTDDGFYTLGSAGGAWRLNQRGLAGQQVTQVALHPTQLLTFYAAAAAKDNQPAGIYRTTSNGFEWEMLLPGEISAMAVAVDEVKKRRTKARDDESEEAEEQPFAIYAAASDDDQLVRFYRTDDDGDIWLHLQDNLPERSPITDLLPLTRSTLYTAHADGSIYYSDDSGKNWQQRGQVDGKLNQLVKVGDDLFATTGRGLYRSSDEGRTWQRLNRFYLDAGPLAVFQPTTEPGVLLVGGDDDSIHTIYRLTTDSPSLAPVTFAPDPGNGMEPLVAIAAHPTVRGACYALTMSEAWASSDKGAIWERIESPAIPRARAVAVAKI